MRARKTQGPRPVSPPDLPARLATPLFPAETLAVGSPYSEQALADWDVSGQAADDLRFDAVLLERVHFSGTVAKRLRLRDARLSACDLSNASWSAAAWERCELLAGRLTGLKCNEAAFSDVRFVGCKADLAQFRHASFRDVRFEGGSLRDADFQGATLRGVSFHGCDLQGANFTGATLEQADFRGARIDQLVLRPADLKGMIIDSGQALELATFLAASLGMTVADR